ncbi:MAG: DMT family transporter [Chloroflexi bacterium]|nr:DMT family transporter [Chloroflexota bacterium]
MLGIVLAILASMAWAAGAVIARMGLAHMRTTTGTAISLASGLVLTMGLAFAFYREAIFALPGWIFLWFLLHGTLSFPMGRFFQYMAYSLAGVGRAATLVGAAPIFASLLAILFAGETITLPLLLGTMAVVGGVALIVSER